MWEGVTYVEPSRRPVIHEGSAAHAIVTNAGPANVDLCVWDERTSDRERQPTFKMTMLAGNTRSVSGPMIFSCSMIDPGHPCVMMIGSASGFLERT